MREASESALTCELPHIEEFHLVAGTRGTRLEHKDTGKSYVQTISKKPYALIAISMAEKYELPRSAGVEIEAHLERFESMRKQTGKTTTRDHLTQEAAMWCRQHANG